MTFISLVVGARSFKRKENRKDSRLLSNRYKLCPGNDSTFGYITPTAKKIRNKWCWKVAQFAVRVPYTMKSVVYEEFSEKEDPNISQKLINELFSVRSVCVRKGIVNTSPAKFSLGRRDAVSSRGIVIVCWKSGIFATLSKRDLKVPLEKWSS